MRINKSSSRKVSTRRAHRPDQKIYRSLRRVTLRDRRKLFVVETIVIVLLLAVVAFAIKYFFF